MNRKIICKNEIDDLFSVDMQKLLSRYFQYGMSMDGVLLHHNRDDSVIYIINSDYMSLIYRCQTEDFCGDIKQKINLDWQSHEYGNTKVNFICPECGKKAMILYGSGISFMCRKCIKTDETQSMSDKEQTASIFSKLNDGTIMDAAFISC